MNEMSAGHAAFSRIATLFVVAAANIGGLGLVFIIGVAVIGLGIVIMIVQAIRRPAFFRGESLSLDAPASVRPKR